MQELETLQVLVLLCPSVHVAGPGTFELCPLVAVWDLASISGLLFTGHCVRTGGA